MTDAYKCDKCDEYKDGSAWFSGDILHTSPGEYGEWDLCQECFNAVRPVLENPAPPEDWLDKRHHNAPKDANDDPEGI